MHPGTGLGETLAVRKVRMADNAEEQRWRS